MKCFRLLASNDCIWLILIFLIYNLLLVKVRTRSCNNICSKRCVFSIQRAFIKNYNNVIFNCILLLLETPQSPLWRDVGGWCMSYIIHQLTLSQKSWIRTKTSNQTSNNAPIQEQTHFHADSVWWPIQNMKDN